MINKIINISVNCLKSQNMTFLRQKSTMGNDELLTAVEITAFQTTFDFAARFGITILTM